MGGKIYSYPRQRPDRDAHLRKLNRRLSDVSHRVGRRKGRRWYRRDWKLIAALLVFAGLCGWSLAATNTRSVWDGVRHVLAAPNCSMARLVGLAPARRGQPGYWSSHDRDNDGIACEPWHPRW
jgi:hypothetical protein